LITRPEPGASETAARVVALGLLPIIAPLLAITQKRPHLPPPATLQAVAAASGNAVAALPESHRDLPLLAVGRATADRARNAGFSRVISADGDAGALVELVARTCMPSGAPLLLVAGSGQGAQLARDLRARGFRVVRRAVYTAIPVPALPETARAALAADKLRAALFFSAETARQCVRLLQGARLDEAVHTVEALAIGKPAAVALQALPWRRIRVAARPTQDAMLALLR
jgi:uroporphyrinogen-III synthase